MAIFSHSEGKLPWTRYWSPRRSRNHSATSEFLQNPEDYLGKHLHPHATPLAGVVPEIGLLVLCGEPGLGKSTELASLRERLNSQGGDSDRVIDLTAREFDSFPDLQGHLESHPSWKSWLTSNDRLTILLDGVDEGLIRMPTLVARLRTFLETKPIERCRLVLACRSFEWPEAEGEQLASLWLRDQKTEFIFELEPLRREDAQLAAERKGLDGGKFLEAVHLADVASLASRPITLFFLLDEFVGNEFQTTSRRELYKKGCRRMCEEHNPERAHLLRRLQREESTTDEKVAAAGKLACGLLLAGKNHIFFRTSSQSLIPSHNVCRAAELIQHGLLSEATVEDTLGTALFTAIGLGNFGFVHQTYAECMAGQTLSELPLAQLRTLLCATDPASGDEYVIPQLAELASWVAGDHEELFSHLVDIDPGALLRSGVAFATPNQKAMIVGRILDLAGRNQFFDESEYWRFWRDLDHPALPGQLEVALRAPNDHPVIRRLAVDIAEACRREEMVPALFAILKSEKGDKYFRSSVADALCASMPDDRLSELEPLFRGEVGPDPDQSILGHALQRLVPGHLSVADALPRIGRTLDSSYFGSYWRSLDHLANHVTTTDILPGLRAIRKWTAGFSSTSFRRKLSMALLLRGLEHIDDPLICVELVKLWKAKAKNFREFFRTGDRDDADFARIKEQHRRKWITAIINSCDTGKDDKITQLTWDTYRLIKPEDFPWLLESLLQADKESAPFWAKVVRRMIQHEEVRLAWWDQFINAYRNSLELRHEMPWFEETSINTPSRRSAKADWLWHFRRFERHREKRRRPSPIDMIARAVAKISAGESWAFIDLCWALSLDPEGFRHELLGHDIIEYPGWANISEGKREFVLESARRFLLERSDGYLELGTRTNYSDPGVVAIWQFRREIESNEALRTAVASKWIEAILGIWDSSAEHAKELFSLAYRINPVRTLNCWIREIRRESERHGHPFAIRRAKGCFDAVVARELIELLKVLEDPRSVRMTIYELKSIDQGLAQDLGAYLLQREILRREPRKRMVEALLIAGIATAGRQAWRTVFAAMQTRPELAVRVLRSVASDADSSDRDIFKELAEDEIGDLYLLLCRLFPHSEDPEELSGEVTPRRSMVHFRSGVLNTLSARSNLAACAQLKRIATALPDQASWLLYRYQQTLSAFRRNEWQPSPSPDIAVILSNDHKRIVRDNWDLMSLVLESLGELQRHLKETTLPAVEDLWRWEGAGLDRKNFRHKDEESVSDYVARWLRDRIGPESRVVINREVQPTRGSRTDVLVQAWSHTPAGRMRQESPLDLTIEVKGCWNGQVKTGAENQLLDQYLRPFRRTHGIFLVAWFHSPAFEKLAPKQTSKLKFETLAEAQSALATFVEPAQGKGFEIVPFILDLRLG